VDGTAKKGRDGGVWGSKGSRREHTGEWEERGNFLLASVGSPAGSDNRKSHSPGLPVRATFP
jgi:hypothetical protein